MYSSFVFSKIYLLIEALKICVYIVAQTNRCIKTFRAFITQLNENTEFFYFYLIDCIEK